MKKAFFLAILLFIFISGCSRQEYPDLGYFESEIENAKAKGVEKEDLPFAFITGGKKGVLLVHGLTATPWEVREIGIYLAQRNITVYAPLLEGHGNNPYELETTTWNDWYGNVDAAYLALSKYSDHVYLIGVSTGADIALVLGANRDFNGIVSIGAPIWLRDKRAEFSWLYKHFSSYRYIEKEVTGEQKGHYYELLPSRSVYELMKLVLQVRKSLPKVDEPVLIIQSVDDNTVHPKSAEYIYEHLGSGKKEISWKEKVPHVIFEENKDEVFEQIYNFINEN